MGGVAHLGERIPCTDKVAGSIPVASTMSTNFFCPLPWNHLMFKSTGEVQACCETYSDKFLPSESIKATANNPIMRQLRLDLLEPDVVPSMCYKCSNREKFQNTSVRISSLGFDKYWTEHRAREATNPDGSMDNFILENLDIRWSNLCNYKCRFCSLQSSHSWLKDHKLQGKQVAEHFDPKTGIAEYDMDWKDLKTHLPHVRFIKLAGGEPTIMPGTYQLLEELIRVKNKSEISLITNATTVKYGQKDLLELLKNFGGIVRIQMSMEGMGDVHEWSRSGKEDWHEIAENIDKFYEYGQANNWRINFHSGISWMNMYHLADFILAYPHIPFVFNLVTDPAEMSIENFYRYELEKCSEYYQSIITQQQDHKVLKHLNVVKYAIDVAIQETKEDIDLDKFRRTQGLLDRSRNQSFAKAFPEWKRYA